MSARLRRLLRPLPVVAAAGLFLAGLFLAGLFLAGLSLAGLSAAPAAAVEMPGGTKNFTAPHNVPNYFSNESGSFNGGASAGAAQSAIAPAVAAPSRRDAVEARQPSYHSRRYARVRGRTRLAHHHLAHHHRGAPQRTAYRAHRGGRPAAHVAARYRSAGHRMTESSRRIARAGR